MILGHHAIKAAFDTVWFASRGSEVLGIERLKIGANSVDVTLHEEILVPNVTRDIVDPCSNQSEILFDHAVTNRTILKPGDFLLGSVNERFDCSFPFNSKYFAPMIDGRSTIARLGVSIHSSAGFGDHGFDGAFTLEISNQGPFVIKLTAGMRIAQVFFMEVDIPKKYVGAYSSNHNNGPVSPILGKGRF